MGIGSAGATFSPTTSGTGNCRPDYRVPGANPECVPVAGWGTMSTTTLILIILLVLVLTGGGGYYYSRR